MTTRCSRVVASPVGYRHVMTDANTSTGASAPPTAESLAVPDGATTHEAAEHAAKPTDQWVTGDEPITGPQASYLETLAREAGEEVPEHLTKAQASELIDRLQRQTGRGAAS